MNSFSGNFRFIRVGYPPPILEAKYLFNRKHSVRLVFSRILLPPIFADKKVMWNLKQFQEIYSRYESSGLKVQDFCANEVINEAKFYYWQKKLREKVVSPKGFAPIVLDTQNLSASMSMSSIVSNSINLPDCKIVYPWGLLFD